MEVHPFDDGNGRMARLLTNFILLKYGYPVSVIKQENRNQYYAALSQADNGEVIPIIEFISETVKSTFEITLKAIHGEDISDEDDLDKEIELFRKEIGHRKKYVILKENADVLGILHDIIKYPSQKLLKFSDLFHRKSILLKSTNGQVAISQKEINSKQEFKVLINKHPINLNSIINYNFFFQNSVHNGGDVKIEKGFSIRFNKETYTIELLGNRLVKYYDENLYDDSFKSIMRIYMRSFMNEIKKNSK